MIKRYLEKYIVEDLKDKMVFISGARQAGKTTLAKQIGEKSFAGKYGYLNWDNRQDRKDILSGTFAAGKKLFIFDEIHKYKNWKAYLKGEYDKRKDEINILATGSARLDIYRKGGDSLLGRYHSYRLHILSAAELMGAHKRDYRPYEEIIFPQARKAHKGISAALFKFGGFPEIFIKQSEKALRRWHN